MDDVTMVTIPGAPMSGFRINVTFPELFTPSPNYGLFVLFAIGYGQDPSLTQMQRCLMDTHDLENCSRVQLNYCDYKNGETFIDSQSTYPGVTIHQNFTPANEAVWSFEMFGWLLTHKLAMKIYLLFCRCGSQYCSWGNQHLHCAYRPVWYLS
jgi:hypothetical protein